MMLDSFEDNLLSQIEVCNGKVYRAAAGGRAGQKWDVVAGGVLVVIKCVQNAFFIRQYIVLY